MKCPFCFIEAVWVENKEIYGKNYGKSYMCWLCKDCDAYVGCHNNTKKPLGIMANAETRQYRMKVHKNIDKLWKSGIISRKELYKEITKKLGLKKQYHTGYADIKMCKQLLELYK